MRYFELFHFDIFLMISSLKWASLTTTNIALTKSQKYVFQKWCRFEKHIKLKLILEKILSGQRLIIDRIERVEIFSNVTMMKFCGNIVSHLAPSPLFETLN